jgi:hypothetical protein
VTHLTVNGSGADGGSAPLSRTLLAPPARPAEWLADGVRALAPVSVVVAAVGWGPQAAGVMALTVPAVLLPRAVAARPWFDILAVSVILVAAWSNVLGLYESVRGWDLVVHAVCTGVLAALAYLVLARSGVVPAPRRPGMARRTPIVIVIALGLALSALWEILEWVGTLVAPDIYVAYRDTIGDMAAGGLGTVVAGIVTATVRLQRDQERPPRPISPRGPRR